MYSEFFLNGVKINSFSFNYLVKELDLIINEKKQKEHISITNTEAMYIASINKTHLKYINQSKFSICDGIGLKIAAKFNGISINRYHGPDLMKDILNISQLKGWTHYFLGAKKGVADSLKDKMIKKFPDLKILSCYSPPFRKLNQNEERDMINEINLLKPDFLWVSLGLPKQEKWIMKYKNVLDAKIFIGIGAAFDFHTGNINRAPIFFQKIGMEWFYRTMFEHRLIVRQYRGFKFLFRSIFKQI